MSQDLVLVEDRGAVRVLTLNRPEKRNAANLEMQQRIKAELQAAAADPEVAVLVLTGAGTAFSAGGEVAVAEKMAGGGIPNREAYATNYMETLRTFLTMDLPVVAAVNGPAYGYAAGLVALCDLVVMAEDARLCDPHVNYGGPADLSTRLMWPRLASVALARDLLMTGRVIGASEALEAGLCNRVVPAGQALAAAMEVAESLAALPRAGVRTTRKSFTVGLLEEAERILAVLTAGMPE